MRLRNFGLLFLILLAAPKGFTQSSTPTAANQVNVTDGLGGYTLQPYGGGSATLPTATGVGQLLNSLGAGTSYAAQSKVGGLDPRDYGADFNGQFVADATTTSGSNVVTCANSDCNFPSNISGYIIFATAGNGSSCLDNPSITFGSALQTTVTGFTNANSITVSGTSNTTATATACLAWFPKDSTAALTSWWNAGGCRGVYQVPAGITLFSSPIMQNLSGCPGAANTAQAYPGQTVHGAGVGSTYFVASPIFTYTSIIGQQATNCAVGNLNVEHMDHLTVYGLGTRAATTINACLIMVGQASSAFRIDGVGWNARGGGANMYGIEMIGTTGAFITGGANFFGSMELYIPSGFLQVVNTNFFSGNPSTVTGTCMMRISGTATVTTINNGILGCVQVDSGTMLTSIQDNFNGPDAGGTVFYANGGTIHFHDSTINASHGTTTGLNFTGSSAVTAENTGIFGITGSSGSFFEDLGGNTILGTVTLNSMIWPYSNYQAAVPVTGSNLVLGAGWGTSPTVSVFTNVDERHFMMLVTAGSGAQTQATSTITYTFPRAFFQAPGSCHAQQVGGSNGILTILTNTVPTTTSVQFLPTAAATASQTLTIVVDCQ